MVTVGDVEGEELRVGGGEGGEEENDEKQDEVGRGGGEKGEDGGQACAEEGEQRFGWCLRRRQRRPFFIMRLSGFNWVRGRRYGEQRDQGCRYQQ